VVIFIPRPLYSQSHFERHGEGKSLDSTGNRIRHLSHPDQLEGQNIEAVLASHAEELTNEDLVLMDEDPEEGCGDEDDMSTIGLTLKSVLLASNHV
jgi:hypothetical protein